MNNILILVSIMSMGLITGYLNVEIRLIFSVQVGTYLLGQPENC